MRSKPILGVVFVVFFAVMVVLALSAERAKADDLYGSIRGTVTDASGAAVPGVTVTATNIATNVSKHVTSDSHGAYSFLQLPIGDYNVRAEKSGFKVFATTKIHLDVNQVYALAVKMEVGSVTQEVEVEANGAQVNTTTPQLGTVIDANQIVNMPLLGRNWLQLQQLEPGVEGASDRFGTGTGGGNFSTNGSQTTYGTFLVDGTDTNDIDLNTQTFNLSPDAISEFREVTSTINPEYARSSGVIVNALTKTGTNAFHGDLFEFYRDTFLDSRGFFEPQVSTYHQNQFGGTVGGPVIKNHTFFFFSYQGVRSAGPQNVLSTSVPVFSSAQRTGGPGAFADLETSTGTSPIPLTGDNGTVYAAGTPYSTIFSTGTIPTADFNSVSAALLAKYVPPPTPGAGTNFEFNPLTANSHNQYMARIDQNFGAKDLLWGTWIQEAVPTTDTIPFPGTGANIPGFGEVDQEHFKFLTLAWTHILNDHMVNELRGGYNRFNYNAVNPETPTLPSSAGFTITPQTAAGAGLPVIDVAGLFDLGFSNDAPQPRIDQTYEGVDNFSWSFGRHTMKLGFDMRRWQVWNPFYFQNNGFYNFAAAGTYTTGDAGADFLLGFPDSYSQGSGQVEVTRARQYYSYVQDEFKLKPNLTLTYGLGWTIDTPMIDIAYNGHAQFTFIPGQQSTVYPNAPVGVVYEGDRILNASGGNQAVNPAGSTHYNGLGPRAGFAYSPDWGWISGGPGRMSIRGGYGIYYDRSETEQAGQVSASSPPFAISSAGAGSVGTASFGNPFVDLVTGATVPNPFPFAGAPNTVNFATTPGFQPIWTSCCATASPDTRDPMIQNWNLTVQRQLPGSAILTLGYVGSKGRDESVALPINTATNVAPCLLDTNCNIVTQTNGSGPGAHPEDFKYAPNVYGTIDTIFSIGSSNYNAFQASYDKHLSHNLQMLVSYTYAHSLDNGSGFENSGFAGSFGSFGGFGEARSSNPYCWPRCDYASSTFDARHRLVISYFYQIPGLHGNWMLSRLTRGWTLAGITTFQTGFPLDVTDSSDPSLGCQTHSDFVCWDGPDLVGPVAYENPRAANSGGSYTWFSGSAFSPAAAYPTPTSGETVAPLNYGNAPRNLCC